MGAPEFETAAASRVSRRWLLVRGLLGAGVLALPARPVTAAGLARVTRPRSVTFSEDLSWETFASDSSAADWLTSGPLRAPGRFDLLGLSWEAGPAGAGEVRGRLARGAWSRWVALRSAADHRPDGARSFAGSDPVWFGGADVYEVRLRRAHVVRVDCVNSTGTATAADRRRSALQRGLAVTAAQPAVHIAPGAPAIIPRSAWAGRGARPTGLPLFGDVELAFVHHTDSATDYGPGDSAAMILGIFHFHRDVRGWGDIGYNFIVDKYGQIFEGRAGGMLEAVVGAQAGGFQQGLHRRGRAGHVLRRGAQRAGEERSGAAARLETHVSRRADTGTCDGLILGLAGQVPARCARPAQPHRRPPRRQRDRLSRRRPLRAADRLAPRRRRDAANQPTASFDQRPTIAAGAQRIRARSPLALGGTAGDVRGELTLLVERQTTGGFLRTLTTNVLPAAGEFQAAINLPRAGVYRITARGNDSRELPLRSNPTSVIAVA